MHIVWDWNGTSSTDRDAILDATNEVFRSYGLPPMELDHYRSVSQPPDLGLVRADPRPRARRRASGSGSTPRSTTPITA